MTETKTLRYGEPLTLGDLRRLRADEYGMYTLGVGVYAYEGTHLVSGGGIDGNGTLALDVDGEPMSLSEFLDSDGVAPLGDDEKIFFDTDTGWYTLAEVVVEDATMSSYLWMMG